MRQPTATRINPDTARRAREAAGLSLETAARRAASLLPEGRQVSMSTIQRLEAGKIAAPEPYVIAALAEVYDVDMSDLAPEMVGELPALVSLLERQAVRCARSAERAAINVAVIPGTARYPHPGRRAAVLAWAVAVSPLALASGQ